MTNWRVPRKKKKLIPKDVPYCYTMVSDIIYESGQLPYYKTKTCPFYQYKDGLEGYCKLVKCEVMDQVKECGMRCGY